MHSGDHSSIRTLLPLFFADLKRRRVFQAMAVYGAASFAALEALSLIQPVLFVPDWMYRGAAFSVLAGFPVFVIVTWIFDYEAGLVRTPPASPEELDAIVHTARMRRWTAGVLALAGLGLLGLSVRSILASPPPPSSVAVLPLANRTTAPSDAFFIGGLHDDILEALSRDPSLRVVSRTSVERFGDEPASIPEVADRLGVAAVVEGGVQRWGDTVRVTIQVIRGRPDEHLWAGHWDVALPPGGSLEVQSEVAASVARAIRHVLAEPG